MKRILQEGTTSYRAHCHECGAVFVYERDDVHHNYVRGGEWVSCPSCGHALMHHGVSGTQWPDGRRRRLGLRGGYQPSGPLPKGSCFGA